MTGPRQPGPDETGSERPGPDETRPEQPALDETGSEQPGPDAAGPDQPAPDETGSEQPGPEATDASAAADGWNLPGLSGAELPATLERLHRRLAERGQTVAVAESMTGGMLAAALTSTAGASASFRGGVVVYATDLKARLAGVPESLLAEQGPVAAQVALELARGVRDRLSASWGVGVTGVAGPQPQDGKAVGTVFLAVSGPGDGIESVSELNLAGNRNTIRARAVEQAVALLAGAVNSLAGQS
ncbi:MAG: nicotinamide-nucleotide amidohydrolase family protein [Actinobacteria bacterium]|nr:nicotinamide-nucleotide amidohydrolase family protein [Actinomycetota bacterium]